MPPKPPAIPRAQLPEGIRRCLAKSNRLNEDALTLLESSPDSLVNASVLFSYAVEELGKAALLRDAMDDVNDPVVVSGFYNHPEKLRRAERLLGEDALELRPGAFQRAAFSSAFDVGTNASYLEDRLHLLYVDWHGAQWRSETTAEAACLQRAIASLRIALVERRADWV